MDQFNRLRGSERLPEQQDAFKRSFAFMEDEARDDMEQIYELIGSQGEVNFDDMISDNLVRLERDIFMQIRSQV